MIRSVRRHAIASICDDDYRWTLLEAFPRIVCNPGGGCIIHKLPDPAHPNCFAQDRTWNVDGTVTITPLPACADQPDVTCWRLEEKAECTGTDLSPDRLGVVIDRHGEYAPDHTSTMFQCSVGC